MAGAPRRDFRSFQLNELTVIHAQSNHGCQDGPFHTVDNYADADIKKKKKVGAVRMENIKFLTCLAILFLSMEEQILFV